MYYVHSQGTDLIYNMYSSAETDRKKIASELDRMRATFDSRVFNLPPHEIFNYFWWRQSDWIRNSVMMYARQWYSDKQLFKKDHRAVKKMLEDDGHPSWDTLDTKWQNGKKITTVKNIIEKNFGSFENY